MYQVIIVEDDSMVASINRKYVETVGGFEVAGSFKNGGEALEYLKENGADLVILDYYMPGMNGDVFLDRLREEGLRAEVIMVTSANSVEIVRELMNRGVRDYLVKPFEYERFYAALSRFRNERDLLLRTSGAMEQAELDKLFLKKTDKGHPVEALPKGMNQKTLDLVLECLKKHSDKHLTCDEMSRLIGLSRITVRRYLNYLVEGGRVESRIDYRTGGRPGIEYILS